MYTTEEYYVRICDNQQLLHLSGGGSWWIFTRPQSGEVNIYR